jgi:squalene-hopene/tetraprenyl-beta-curcumene cyclase
MKNVTVRTCILAACLAGNLYAQGGQTSVAGAGSWNPKAAAAYLDGRIAWWIAWPSAARDHETFCISCHTAAPYAMARAALRADLAEQGPSANERKVLDNVIKRVRMWKEVEPFYPDEKRGAPKTAESRGTESIFNAVILAGYDVPGGKLSPDARLALDNMWAEQLKTGEAKGAWAWLQFHNSPWEGDSQYYGATLAAIAIGTAPGNYRSAPEIQDGLKALRDYLVKERESQILIDRVILLWASTKVPGLLTRAEQKSIMDEALGKQQADGGFSLSSFVGAWKRADGTPLETGSDGYATGVVALALERAGLTRERSELMRALAWLNLNQDRTEGRWLAWSLNKKRDLSTDVGRFMSDAATAYAVLALESAR